MTVEKLEGQERKAPVCYIVELSPGHYVVCDLKLEMTPDENSFAEQVFENYARSNASLLRAAALPDHLAITRYSGQLGR